MFVSEHLEKLRGCGLAEQKTFGRLPADWSRQIGCAAEISSQVANTLIGRDDLYKIWEQSSNCDALFINTMAWGGMTIKNGKRAFSHRQSWRPVIQMMLKNPESRSSIYEAFEQAPVPGMGPAYYTKLLHFGSTAKIDKPGYIMDQWTAKSVNLLLGRVLVKLNYAGYVCRTNDRIVYEEFCQTVEALSAVIGETEPSRTEELLFSRGKPHSAEWRKYVVENWKRTCRTA